MRFTKMEGLGNDYVYVDLFADSAKSLPTDTSALAAIARRVSDRHFGIGSDGLILIGPGQKAPYRMRMFNSDGSESAMCGNGLRCVAKFVADRGYVKGNADEFVVESGAGVHNVKVVARDKAGKVAKVRLDMGEPRLTNAEIPALGPATERSISAPLTVDGQKFAITTVSMGNPHCVIFVDDTAKYPVTTHGPKLETHAHFPKRTNVEFVQVLSKGEMNQRTWERGAGETMACGSGACAVLVAAVLNGKTDRKATIHLLGGDLEIEWDAATNHVFKTGPAVEVFSGEIAV